MGNFGITELLLILVTIFLGVLPLIGSVMGFLAFLKVSRIEKALKEQGLI